MNAGNKKHTQHAPSTKTECDYLNGWIKKRSHTQKSHPKVVNPRDIAGERKKKKKRYSDGSPTIQTPALWDCTGVGWPGDSVPLLGEVVVCVLSSGGPEQLIGSVFSEARRQGFSPGTPVSSPPSSV